MFPPNTGAAYITAWTVRGTGGYSRRRCEPRRASRSASCCTGGRAVAVNGKWDCPCPGETCPSVIDVVPYGEWHLCGVRGCRSEPRRSRRAAKPGPPPTLKVLSLCVMGKQGSKDIGRRLCVSRKARPWLKVGLSRMVSGLLLNFFRAAAQVVGLAPAKLASVAKRAGESLAGSLPADFIERKSPSRAAPTMFLHPDQTTNEPAAARTAIGDAPRPGPNPRPLTGRAAILGWIEVLQRAARQGHPFAMGAVGTARLMLAMYDVLGWGPGKLPGSAATGQQHSRPEHRTVSVA
jgi:hypothetical protein